MKIFETFSNQMKSLNRIIILAKILCVNKMNEFEIPSKRNETSINQIVFDDGTIFPDNICEFHCNSVNSTHTLMIEYFVLETAQLLRFKRIVKQIKVE